MRRVAIIFLILLAAEMRLPAVTPVGLLPEEKVGITLAESERNPFGKRGPKTPAKSASDTESEEARIRGILASMPAAGTGERDGKYSALLGSFVISPGQALPLILENQTEKVRVLKVDQNTIELGFVEKDESAETRKITLPIRLKPEVRYSLGVKTVSPDSQEAKASFGGVIKPNEEKTGQK